MLDRARDNLPWNSLRPIAIRQKPVNHVEIEPRAVGTDQKLSAAELDDRVGSITRQISSHILNRD